MNRALRLWCAVLLGSLLLAGCTINRDIMFKTPTDHAYDVFTDTATKSLILQPNDVLQFRLFANDGFKMIDLVSEGGAREASITSRNLFTYFIEADGEAKLPLLGHVKLAGYSLRRAEIVLEELYATYYNKPYVQLMVSNRRVVVFPGGGGDAKVITLENNNTTLLEVLALAGGMSKRGDARRIKLFRHDDSGRRKVYEFDMSDIEGLGYADLVMQGDDVLYVQPNPELAREVLTDLTPMITLLTSVILVIGIVRGLQ